MTSWVSQHNTNKSVAKLQNKTKQKTFEKWTVWLFFHSDFYPKGKSPKCLPNQSMIWTIRAWLEKHPTNDPYH